MKNKKINQRLLYRSHGIHKRGISAIVATVLVVLITVAAVTIVWAAIMPMIKDKLNTATFCVDAVSQISLADEGYTCKDGNNVSVQIKRGPKDFNLTGIHVSIFAAGSSTSYIINSSSSDVGLPGTSTEKVYTLDTGGPTTNIDKIEISPIVGIGKTTQNCDVSGSMVLSDC